MKNKVEGLPLPNGKTNYRVLVKYKYLLAHKKSIGQWDQVETPDGD